MPARDPVGRTIERLCAWIAFAGALALVGIALLSAVSIIGRAVFSTPIQGDYELVQMGCAIFIASCMPITQIRYGHSPGRRYYDRKLAEGKTPREAVRALKRRLSDVVWRHLVADARRVTG